MVSVTTLPHSRPFTRADLDSMPDDGHRYELIDGTLIVTPAPSPRHQTAVLELGSLLREHSPDHRKVFVAPLDVALSEDTVMQPDVLVTRRTDLTERNLAAAPLLAVEILSPSTRQIDLTLKRARYEVAGCPAYWVVDPELSSLTVWELRDGAYAEVAHCAGDQEYAATVPFPVTITPRALIDD